MAPAVLGLNTRSQTLTEERSNSPTWSPLLRAESWQQISEQQVGSGTRNHVGPARAWS